MAVKALAMITLHAVVDVAAIYRYYKLQSSTADAPEKPVVKPSDPQREAPSGWQITEPAYTENSTNSLYTVDLNLFSDESFQYSSVSLSSSYEAAKKAYNEAAAAAKRLASWCAKNNQTLIDGAKIYTGSITAEKISIEDLKALQAKIGGFTIGDTNLRNGTTSLAGADNSVYLGLDGISCGQTFKVDKAGNLNATAGVMGGFTIKNNFLTASTDGFTRSFFSGLSAGGRPEQEYEAAVSVSAVPYTSKWAASSAQDGYTPITSVGGKRLLEFISFSLTETPVSVVNDVAGIGITYDYIKDESKLVLQNTEGNANILLGSDIDLWAGENSDINMIANTIGLTGGNILFKSGQSVGSTDYPSGPHTLKNNTSVGFLTSTGVRARGMMMGSTDNLLFGRGDEGLTNGMYFYVGAKDTFGVYGGSTKDVRFRSFKSGDSMYIQAPDVYNRTTSTGSNVRVNSNGTLYRYSSSSMRYKKDITTKLGDELDPERLYDLKIWQYKYREGHLDKNDQRYGQDIIGFIAEDVKQKYPIAVNYNEDGQIENWNVEMIVPAMLKLIQNQKKEIDELKERLTDGEKDEDKRKSGSCTDKSVPDRDQRRGHYDHGRLHKGAGKCLTGACKAG